MVGYNARCKLCNCEQRAEVERMHEGGASLQQIVTFLSGHGVSLSKPAVKRHFYTHFAPKEEAAKCYYGQSQMTMETAVDRRVEQLNMLDDMIARNYRLNKRASEWSEQQIDNGGIFMEAKPMVDLLNGTASEFRQALKLRAELLGETDEGPARVVIVDDLEGDGKTQCSRRERLHRLLAVQRPLSCSERWSRK